MAIIKVKLTDKEKKLIQAAGVKLHHIDAWIKAKEDEFGALFILYKIKQEETY